MLFRSLNVDHEAAARLEQAFREEHTDTLTHEEWVARNLEIHHLLGHTCSNRYYEAVLTPLLNLTREMVLVVKPSHTVIHDHAEHRRIIDAVASGDGEASSEAMRDHVAKVGASLIDLEKAYRRKRGLSDR